MYSKKWLIYCYFQFLSCHWQQTNSCHLSCPHMLSSYFTMLSDMINIALCIYKMWNIERCRNSYLEFELEPLFSDLFFLLLLSNILYMFGYHLCVIGNDGLTDIGQLLLLYVWYQSFWLLMRWIRNFVFTERQQIWTKWRRVTCKTQVHHQCLIQRELTDTHTFSRWICVMMISVTHTHIRWG